jgi:hypothetical protein
VHDLGHTPLGAHYDEAANAVLANEIAAGARPLFIRAYTGKEVGYFYLAAAVIRLIGQPLIAVRLASAAIGMLSIAISYRAAREMFGADRHGTWIGLLAAAIQAINLWAITVSRLGFRAVLQPPLQALTILFVYRGLRDVGLWGAGSREASWRLWLNWALAGAWCGLAAYSYLAIRAFPILLALFFLWILVFCPDLNAKGGHPALRGRIVRLGQFALFALVAALVFAPLGFFYARNPSFFATRMGQVSVFSPEVGGDDPWGTFWNAVRVSFSVFVLRGDLNWRFNVPGAPALWWPLGAFFVVGLAIGIWRLAAFVAGVLSGAVSAAARHHSTPGPGYERAMQAGTYWLLLLWLPVMLLPSILGGGDVELSLSLRAIGVMPALFWWPALGLSESAWALQRWISRRGKARVGHLVTQAALAALLAAAGVHAYLQTFHVWGPSVPGYYVSSGDLVDAAEYANAQIPPGAQVYVSSEHYRHPTMALLAERYEELKWLIGAEVLVFPAATDQGSDTWILLTHDAMLDQEVLDRFFPVGAEGAAVVEHLAPDGQVAFRAYRLAPGQGPILSPDHAGTAHLGQTLTYMGYDLNAPAASGEPLDVTLYLRVERPVDRDDWTFFAHLVDERGFRWGGETFFNYPSGQWEPGEIIVFRKRIPIAPGAPPGLYTLQVGAFSPSLDARLPSLNEDGQISGTTVPVGPIEVARAAAPPGEQPPILHPIGAQFGEALTLLGSDRDRSDLRPGETLALSLHWLAHSQLEPGTTVTLRLERGEDSVSLWQGDPVQGSYPFARWQPPEYVRDRYALRTPLDTAAGDYDLRLSLLHPNGTPLDMAHIASDLGRSGDNSLSLGTIHVHASDRLWEPPPVEHRVEARLGDAIELVGYNLHLPQGQQVARPGDTLHLTLIWRALRPVETSYTVFTHLLDGDQQIRGQQDNAPVNGRYPTTLWMPGEIVVDDYALIVQPDAPLGQYVIEVGLYDPATMQRLPVYDPTGSTGDRILLGSLQVGP